MVKLQFLTQFTVEHFTDQHFFCLVHFLLYFSIFNYYVINGFMSIYLLAQFAAAVEQTDCISAEA